MLVNLIYFSVVLGMPAISAWCTLTLQLMMEEEDRGP